MPEAGLILAVSLYLSQSPSLVYFTPNTFRICQPLTMSTNTLQAEPELPELPWGLSKQLPSLSLALFYSFI